MNDGWYEKLPPPSEAEIDMLDMALAVEPNSRLSCQIICSDDTRRHQGDRRARIVLRQHESGVGLGRRNMIREAATTAMMIGEAIKFTRRTSPRIRSKENLF